MPQPSNLRLYFAVGSATTAMIHRRTGRPPAQGNSGTQSSGCHGRERFRLGDLPDAVVHLDRVQCRGMKIDELIQAFALPAAARVEQHVPRKMLLEQGALTETDKRHFQDGVKDLMWLAEVKPAHVNVPLFKNTERDYQAIAMVRAVFTEQAKVVHLSELIHRAIPHPLILASAQTDQVALSLSHKHHAHGRATGRMALEGVDHSAVFRADEADELAAPFLASLALTAQPTTNLYAMYQGWLDRVHALAAARLSGRFTLLVDAPALAARREALQAHTRLEQSIAKLRSNLEKEKERGRQDELRTEIGKLEDQLLDIEILL